MQFMEPFILGAISAACLVATMFFLRFWVTTRDRLFLMFATAFLLLGFTRLLRGWLMSEPDEHQYIYWIRLVAYLLIVIAIVDKNRPGSRVADQAGE